MDNLVGTRGIADRLGLKFSETVHNWRKRYKDFPEPVANVDGMWLWEYDKVEAWAKAKGLPKLKGE